MCGLGMLSEFLSFPPARRQIKEEMLQIRGQEAFFGKDQIVNIFNSAAHIVPATTTQLCCCGTLEQPQTIYKQMRWLCSNITFQK